MAVEYVQRTCRPLRSTKQKIPLDFVVAKVTPTIEANLGYKLFMLFATINLGGMAVFSL